MIYGILLFVQDQLTYGSEIGSGRMTAVTQRDYLNGVV